MDNPHKISAHIGKTQYPTEIKASGHILIADEPKDAGGTNLGPSPSSYLAASLASCTAITLRMYADRKGWNMSHADIFVQVERDAVQKITKINREIKLFGDLDETERGRLLQIANKCPIHQILSEKINISSNLVPED